MVFRGSAFALCWRNHLSLIDSGQKKTTTRGRVLQELQDFLATVYMNRGYLTQQATKHNYFYTISTHRETLQSAYHAEFSLHQHPSIWLAAQSAQKPI